jgi:hypothetical protein
METEPWLRTTLPGDDVRYKFFVIRPMDFFKENHD